MNDDFRTVLRLDGEGVLGELLERVRAGGVEREAAEALGDRVVLSRDGDELFVYAGSEGDVGAARAALDGLAGRHGLRVAEAGPVERWHPEEERWEDASVPLPRTEAEHEVERARARRHERWHSERTGVPQWEVLVTLPSEDAARRWADALEEQDVRVLRRGRHVMAGAPSEDDARELAQRLEADAPEGSRLEVQGNGQAWLSTLHPFGLFGGRGG